ncbi:hypothetical protein B0H16DRAFT_1469658 [Mycena metata]|uniref:Uncharacterized protein n=1 Tax=Mycena metata TaxID=1033252 RepID=A0AAD7HY50_9AGAR|nr:hypothetical protein B0H16DRAFT_1469658 [Mycena metata]
MALVWRWLGVAQFLCSFWQRGNLAVYGAQLNNYQVFHPALRGAGLGAGAGLDFVLVPRSKKHAEKLKEMGLTSKKKAPARDRQYQAAKACQIPTLPKEQRNCATPSQRQANAMANVGPTPVKRHEAAVMAFAGCANLKITAVLGMV